MPKVLKARNKIVPTQSLPSVSLFFKETWMLYQKVAVPFILLSLIQLVVFFVVLLGLGVGALLIGLALGLGGSVSKLQNSGFMSIDQMMPLIGGVAATVGIFSVVFLAAINYLSSSFQASLILLTAKYKGKISMGEVLNQGFKRVVPVFVLSVIMFILIFGGLLLFIIPGLVMGILMSFAVFEVVLENRKPLAAIKSSISMVSQNFWSIVGRLVLISFATLGMYLLLGIVQSIFSEAIGGLVNIVFNIALMPLGLVFMTVLYQHTKAASELRPVSMIWMWCISLVGLIIGVSLSILIAQPLSKAFEAIRSTDTAAVQYWKSASQDKIY